MSDFKACPFCGRAKHVTLMVYTDEEYSVLCSECGTETRYFSNPNKARERWQSRPLEKRAKQAEKRAEKRALAAEKRAEVAEQERDVLKRRLERDFECICCDSKSVYNEAEDRWICDCEPSPQEVAMQRAIAAETRVRELEAALASERQDTDDWQDAAQAAEARVAELEGRLQACAAGPEVEQ